MGKLKDIDVVILCGGLGKRLKKVLGNNPKAFVEFNGRPFMDILISYLSGLGFRRFILGVGHKAGLIKTYYKKMNCRKIKILFSEEKMPLGTGGALKKAKKLIKSNQFFVLNGDSLSFFNPGKCLLFHKKKQALLTMLLSKVKDNRDYGSVELNRNFCITKFNEKSEKPQSSLVNIGIYIFNKEIFDFMLPVKKFSLEYDLFPFLTGKNIFGYLIRKGSFIDVGTPKRYANAKKYFSNNKIIRNLPSLS